MQDFAELSKQVNTMQEAKTAAHRMMGKNVRYSSLERGKIYLMRVRTTSHQANYDNPFTLVRFLGVGRDDVDPTITKNPRLKEMEETNVQYYFEAIDSFSGQVYQFGAYAFEGSLCICSGAIGVSFYSVTE